MGSRVEQFEQIRRDRDREGLSIRALAERHGVHRRAVRQALASPLPPPKRAPVSRPAAKLGPYRALIDESLATDREAPRKQRHTAKRIRRRLLDEHGADVAEVTVRQYVRQRKRELGWPVGEVFVPQVHAPGMEAEVDRWRHLPASLRAEEARSSQPPAVAHAAPPQRPGQPNCLHHRDPRLLIAGGGRPRGKRRHRRPARRSLAALNRRALAVVFTSTRSEGGPPLAQDSFKLELFL